MEIIKAIRVEYYDYLGETASSKMLLCYYRQKEADDRMYIRSREYLRPALTFFDSTCI